MWRTGYTLLISQIQYMKLANIYMKLSSFRDVRLGVLCMDLYTRGAFYLNRGKVPM